MSSYFQFLSNNSSTASQTQQTQYQQQQQQQQQSQGQSTWTNISSRITTLRKALTKDSEEDDPDDEDASHVSNVLRAYYTQKGQPFPDWLPPDPKNPRAAPQAVPQFPLQYAQYGNQSGNPYGQPAHSRGNSGAGVGMSDLWDSAPSHRPAPAPQSLRAPRQVPQPVRSYDNDARRGSNENYAAQSSQQALAPRPLPSQRAGSFQNTQVNAAPTVTNRDRLKSRLQPNTSGRNSPANMPMMQHSHSEYGYAAGQASNAPYTSASQPWSSTGGLDHYGSGSNYPNYGSSDYRQGSGRQ